MTNRLGDIKLAHNAALVALTNLGISFTLIVNSNQKSEVVLMSLEMFDKSIRIHDGSMKKENSEKFLNATPLVDRALTEEDMISNDGIKAFYCIICFALNFIFLI